MLTWPALSANAGFWISAVVAARFILAAPILRGESPLECAPVTGDGGGPLIMRRLWVRRFNLGIPL
jgi:hypothetical protein